MKKNNQLSEDWRTAGGNIEQHTAASFKGQSKRQKCTELISLTSDEVENKRPSSTVEKNAARETSATEEERKTSDGKKEDKDKPSGGQQRKNSLEEEGGEKEGSSVMCMDELPGHAPMPVREAANSKDDRDDDGKKIASAGTPDIQILTMSDENLPEIKYVKKVEGRKEAKINLDPTNNDKGKVFL